MPLWPNNFKVVADIGRTPSEFAPHIRYLEREAEGFLNPGESHDF